MPTDLARLAPRPQRLTPISGSFAIEGTTPIYLTSTAQPLLFTAQWLQKALAARGVELSIVAAPAPGKAIRLSIDPAQVARNQGYKLVIEDGGIVIVGNDGVGRVILRLSVNLGMALADTGLNHPASAIPPASRHTLAAEMAPLLERFVDLWLQRSRFGGLEDGLASFRRMLDALET